MYICPAPVIVWGLTFCAVENADQAAKSTDICVRRSFVNVMPRASKVLGKQITIRPDWDNLKIPIMELLLRKKFADSTLQKKLVAIEDPIIEENYWGDTFWGVCNGTGSNILGRLLTEIREDIILNLKHKFNQSEIDDILNHL